MLQYKEDKVLNEFYNRFDGRENEISNPLIVRGELLLMASELNMSIQYIATILKDALSDID